MSAPPSPRPSASSPAPDAGVAALVARAVLGALLAAEATALVALPWSTPRGLALTIVVLMPVALLPTIAGAMGGRVLRDRVRAPSLDACLIAPVVIVGLAAGFYFANICFIDLPTDRLTIYGYVASIAATAAAGLLARAALRRIDRRGRLKRRTWRGPAVVLAMVAVAVGLIDTLAFPSAYFSLHLQLAALETALFATSCSLWRLRLRRLAAISLTVAAFALVARHSVDEPWGETVRWRTVHRRALLLARKALDRDRDGFSAAFGGGDCDDADPTAYPLSMRGRDCLGLIGRQPPPVVPAQPDTVVRAVPRRIVLVSIDAFRCGFGVLERPELVDACPRLTALGRAGALRRDTHTAYPGTVLATTAMNAGSLEGNQGRPLLADRLRARGYRTEVLGTHANIVLGPGVRDSFDRVDLSLAAPAGEPAASTAALSTARALERIREAGDGKLFLWVHYFDPHFPYVVEPGQHWAPFKLDAYSAEVRRADRAVGELADALARLPGAGGTVLIVSADHGEDFGEHRGHVSHGSTLYDEATRVPLLVWSAGADARAFVPARLPVSTAELPVFVDAIAAGRDYAPRNEALMQTGNPDDAQVGLVSGGWKVVLHRTLGYWELYDLGADPFERHDLSREQPARLQAMAEQLAARYAADIPPATPPKDRD